MKKRTLWLALSCLIVLSLVLISCGKTTPATTAPTQTQTTTTATTTAPTTIKTTTRTTQTPLTTTTTATAGTPQYGGILRIGDYRLSTYLGNPAVMAEGYAERQAQPAVESLLRVGPTGESVPWLAKSWTLDPVGLTITLNLNTGINFSDGTPFNAAAVKWNLDADTAAKQTGTSLIKSVDAVNDSTVRINLKQWDNTLLDMLAYSYIGEIISPTTAQKNGSVWTGRNPVGTGPFIFETWVPQVTISFSKNPNYWQTGKPYVDRVENVIIVDQTVGLLNFKAGKTDIFVDPILSDLPGLIKQYPATNVLPFAAFATTRAGAIFDSGNPKSPFSDIRVRQAVQYAINPDEMNKVIFGGYGAVSNQFVVPGSWGYDPTIVGYPYNPDKAKQLLSDAGYTSGQLKTTFTFQSGAPYEDVATAVKGYLQAVGINLTLNKVGTLSVINTDMAVGWDGMLNISAVPSPDPAASFETRYIGIDVRYFKNMLVPADYKQAVLSAVTAPDQATKTKFTQQADELFTDKYCLAATWAIQPQARCNQPWAHDDGLYTVACGTQWTPETAWKDAGH